MKLLRWAAAGASVYAVYRYSIGRKAQGEDVVGATDKTVAELNNDEVADKKSTASKPRQSRGKSTKGTKSTKA